MLLYVMRHGPAEDRAASGRDFDRALTPEGRATVVRVARRVHEARQVLGRPWRLLASPFRRAAETAAIVASGASPPLQVETNEDLGADAGLPRGLVAELASAATDAFLVGHQPIVEALVRELLHPARFPLPAGFRTATVVSLEQVPSGWRLADVFEAIHDRESGGGSPNPSG
jgi:phosphohistidine phosphatase